MNKIQPVSVTVPIQLTLEQLLNQLTQEQLFSLQELLHQRLQPEQFSELSVLEEIGLVGCGEAEADLSERYKNEQDQTDYLFSTEANAKHLLDAMARAEHRENLITLTPEEWHEKYRI